MKLLRKNCFMKKLISSAMVSVSMFPASVLAFTTAQSTTAPAASGVTGVSDFYDVIQIAARWLVVFGIIIGAVFIVVGGIQYMTSGGDEEGTKAAKNKIIAGLIGIALVLLAYALVNIVGSFFGAGVIVSPQYA